MGKFDPNTEICSNFHEIWHSGLILYVDLDLKNEILENLVPSVCNVYLQFKT